MHANLHAFCKRAFVVSAADGWPPHLVPATRDDGIGSVAIGHAIDGDVDVLAVNLQRDLQRLLKHDRLALIGSVGEGELGCTRNRGLDRGRYQNVLRDAPLTASFGNFSDF